MKVMSNGAIQPVQTVLPLLTQDICIKGARVPRRARARGDREEAGREAAFSVQLVRAGQYMQLTMHLTIINGNSQGLALFVLGQAQCFVIQNMETLLAQPVLPLFTQDICIREARITEWEATCSVRLVRALESM